MRQRDLIDFKTKNALNNFLKINFKNRVKNNKIQNGTYFLINMAISDLCITLMFLPMNVSSSFAQEWLFGKIGTFFNLFFSFIYSIDHVNLNGV